MSARSRAFTSVDVGVIILLCVFLLLVLPPVVHRPRGGAFRMTCGSQLSGIGKAMMIYANDYDDELPRAGGRDSTWSPIPDWQGSTRNMAYGITSTDGTGGNCTISSCFYLLVRYAEVTPKSFLCKGDLGVSEFTLNGERGKTRITELVEGWDFGATPAAHYSYTYHAPWGTSALTTSSPPGFAVAADRNPWLATPSLRAKPFPTSADGKRTFQGKAGASSDQMYGNSSVHSEDGQNVLFLDSHVTFEKRAYCSLEDDNIYTIAASADAGDPLGTAPVYAPHLSPTGRMDSLLLHDPPTWGQKER